MEMNFHRSPWLRLGRNLKAFLGFFAGAPALTPRQQARLDQMEQDYERLLGHRPLGKKTCNKIRADRSSI